MPQVIPAAIEMVNQRGSVDDGFIVKFMNDDFIALKNVTARRRAATLGKGIEVVKQSSNAARIDLVHDQLRPPISGDDIQLADPLLDPGDVDGGHGKFAEPEP